MYIMFKPTTASREPQTTSNSPNTTSTRRQNPQHPRTRNQFRHQNPHPPTDSPGTGPQTTPNPEAAEPTVRMGTATTNASPPTTPSIPNTYPQTTTNSPNSTTTRRQNPQHPRTRRSRMHQNLHPPIGSPCIRSQTTPNSPNTTTTRSRSPRHPRQRPHPSDSVATRGDSLAHSREAGARLDSFALNTTTRQGGHSVTPLDEGCGTDSPLEVTESPPSIKTKKYVLRILYQR